MNDPNLQNTAEAAAWQAGMLAAPVNDAIGHLFRHHSGQMVASLCRSFGFDKINTIEDAVQDALLAAMKTWPYSGMPDNQFAWLIRTARNRCIDVFRRENRSTSIDDDLDLPGGYTSHDTTYFLNEISEDQLQMIFACCHPEISPDRRIALTLKVVGGFSVAEIANAFLSNSEAVGRSLSRAKSRLRELNVRMEMPVPVELPARLESVLKALYLMFNEGYSASTGDSLIRKDLAIEAMRLTSLLATHPATASPMIDALAALFYFQAARMPARSDLNGELLILAEQDRDTWDKHLITRGIQHLRLSARGDSITGYHLEAEIAAIYTLAKDFESTDWLRILTVYEKLQSSKFSPVIELNRTIVVGQIDGPQAAFDNLKILEKDRRLDSYSLFHITKAHYENLLNMHAAAATSLNKAASLSNNESVKAFIAKKLSSLKGR